MHYHNEINVSTFEEFLQKIEEFKSKGYHLTDTSTDKRVVFDGKNTVECQASVSATLEQGTASYTIIYTI